MKEVIENNPEALNEYNRKNRPVVYGYIRVSTKGQARDGNSLEEQQDRILSRYPDAVCISEAYSGAKERTVFDDMIYNKIKSGDTLVVTKLDRFCRTVREGLKYVDFLISKQVTIHILNMGLIEDTPMGRLIVTNLLAFAEFERSQILERTSSGKNIARQHSDYREGRPPKYSQKQLMHALELKKEYSYQQVSEITGISISTLYRAKAKKSKRI